MLAYGKLATNTLLNSKAAAVSSVSACELSQCVANNGFHSGFIVQNVSIVDWRNVGCKLARYADSGVPPARVGLMAAVTLRVLLRASCRRNLFATDLDLYHWAQFCRFLLFLPRIFGRRRRAFVPSRRKLRRAGPRVPDRLREHKSSTSH